MVLSWQLGLNHSRKERGVQNRDIGTDGDRWTEKNTRPRNAEQGRGNQHCAVTVKEKNGIRIQSGKEIESWASREMFGSTA